MLPPPIQDHRRWWSRADFLIILLFGALFFLPGLGQIPLFDRDEPRFSVAARTMAQTGNYIVPHFNGLLRPDKPPLLYWLINAVSLVTGSFNELTVRLPSALSSMLTLCVVYIMVGSRLGRVTGLFASIILASCSLFIVESRLATADATMLLTITTCMACAWQAWDAAGPLSPRLAHIPRADFLLDRATSPAPSPVILDQLTPATRPRMSPWLALLFWVSLAAGTLVKGVPLVFVFVPMIVLSICTGQLPSLLAQWRSHFRLTRTRIALAASLAAVTAALSAGLYKSDHASQAIGAIVLGVIVIAMILTPGLPGVAFRCLFNANWRWWKHLRPLWGFPLLVALVGWWVVWAGMATDWKLITDMVGTHFAERAFGPLMHWFGIHAAPVQGTGGADQVSKYIEPTGFYTALVWVTFWPWSVLIIPVWYHTWRRLRCKTALAIDPHPYQFLVAFILPMWICLEIARGKLPHYPLPTYVPLAILCADMLVQSWRGLSEVLAARWFALVRWVILGIWFILAGATLFAAHRYLDDYLYPYAAILAAALAATGVAMAYTWNRPSWPIVSALAWAGCLLILDSVLLPNITPLQATRLAGQRISDLVASEPDYHVAGLGQIEPTLVFYSGRNIDLFEDDATAMLKAVHFAPDYTPTEKWVVAVDSDLRTKLDAWGKIYYPLRTYPCFDPANFKYFTITVLTNIPPKDYAPTATRAAATRAALPDAASHP